MKNLSSMCRIHSGLLTTMVLQNFNLINHKMLIALIVLVSFLFYEKSICQCTNVHININYKITRILVYSRFSNTTWNCLHFCDKFIITDIIYGQNYIILLIVMIKTFRPLYRPAFFFLGSVHLVYFKAFSNWSLYSALFHNKQLMETT